MSCLEFEEHLLIATKDTNSTFRNERNNYKAILAKLNLQSTQLENI